MSSRRLHAMGRIKQHRVLLVIQWLFCLIRVWSIGSEDIMRKARMEHYILPVTEAAVEVAQPASLHQQEPLM